MEDGEHLVRCVVYIDLNMVRAGVVEHPGQWSSGGYHEIQSAPARCRTVDRAALAELVGVGSVSRLAKAHGEWIDAALAESAHRRVPEWSESIVVGGREFVERISGELGARARHRQIESCGDFDALHDPKASYSSLFRLEMAGFSVK